MSKPAAAPSRPRKLLLYTASFLVLMVVSVAALAIVEIGLRWFAPQEVRIVRGNVKYLSDYDPLTGGVLHPGAWAHIKGGEYEIDARVNGEGMRDETPHPTPAPPGNIRILALGDSFTFGTSVNYDDSWVVLLEKELRARGLHADVVKAGIPSYDTRAELITLQRLYDRYRPDVVLVCFLPNDLFTNLPSSWRPDSPGQAKEVVNPTDHSWSLQTIMLFQRLVFQSDALYVKLYSMTSRRAFFTPQPVGAAAVQFAVTRDLFGEMQDYCRQRNIRLAVLSVPEFFQVLVKASPVKPPGIDPEHIDQDLGTFAASRGIVWIPTLDGLASDYVQSRQSAYYRVNGHLTPRGNRLVTELLVPKLLPVIQAGK